MIQELIQIADKVITGEQDGTGLPYWNQPAGVYDPLPVSDEDNDDSRR